MATDISVLARRRPVTLARRFRAYSLSAGVRRDRVLFALTLVAALGFLLAILTWPGQVPTITVAPLILLSGLYLANRHLVALYVVLAEHIGGTLVTADERLARSPGLTISTIVP